MTADPTTLRDVSSAEDAVIVIEGVVERGDERGRQLGFPTANVRGVEAVRLDGVYAGTVQIAPHTNGPTFVAAVSVGHRPTYYGKDGLRLLEAHLLDFSGDLYDKKIRIELHVRLRPQRKYVDTPTLVRQLQLDVHGTRAWARANGFGNLLSVGRPLNPRWRPGRRTHHDPVVIARIRDHRRRELIGEAVAGTDPAELTYNGVAEQTGIPVGYLTWRYTTLDDLRAVRR